MAKAAVVVLCGAVVMTVAVGVTAQAPASGRMAGTVRFQGDALSGATVTVVQAGVTQQVVSDSGGQFEFADLSPGVYTVTATLPGFEADGTPQVTVWPGQTSEVAITLLLGCLSEILYVDMGPLAAARKADAIVHLLITGSGPMIRTERAVRGAACYVGHEYTATKFSEMRYGQMGRSMPSSVQFFQDGPVRYREGEEYVALLHWSADMARWTPVTGIMFPVSGGQIRWKGTDTPALRDGMTVAEFMAALRDPQAEPPE